MIDVYLPDKVPKGHLCFGGSQVISNPSFLTLQSPRIDSICTYVVDAKSHWTSLPQPKVRLLLCPGGLSSLFLLQPLFETTNIIRMIV